MKELVDFWNIIVESNTFNFAILLLIFAILYKKLNVTSALEKIKQDVINTINNVKLDKEKAHGKLLDAQKSIEHLEDDIKDRLEEASKRGNSIAAQISASTEEQVKLIEKKYFKSH